MAAVLSRTPASHTRAGQLSVDYLGGALVFFASLVILLSTVMGAMPELEEQHRRDELQLSVWSMSEVVMNDPGYWAVAGANGTDWHKPANRGNTRVVGLRSNGSISPDKLAAFKDMNYQQLKQVLDMGSDKDFSVEFTEFIPVNTKPSFPPGNPPSFITPPPGLSSSTSQPVHYGSEAFGGQTFRFLWVHEGTWYNKLYVSTDWHFGSGTEDYDLNQENLLLLNDDTYIANIGNNQISDGKLLVLQKPLGRAGTAPPRDVEDLVSITRFGVMNGNVVKGVFRIWM